MDNSWCAPGVRCVCVRDDWEGHVSCDGFQIPVRVPMIGEVLTVREVNRGDGSPFGGVDGEPYLAFWEIDALQVDGPLSMTVRWRARHFQPLTEQKTDISVFEALLDTAGQPANV